MKDILHSLGINKNNYGACIGADEWCKTTDSGILHSINPANGKEIASVYQCSENDYDQIILDNHFR